MRRCGSTSRQPTPSRARAFEDRAGSVGARHLLARSLGYVAGPLVAEVVDWPLSLAAASLLDEFPHRLETRFRHVYVSTLVGSSAFGPPLLRRPWKESRDRAIFGVPNPDTPLA